MSDLPSGWEWTTLYEVASWGSGGTPKRTVSGYFGGDVPWAVIGDLNDAVVTETAETITEAALASSSAKIVPKGAVLLAMYGSIGKLGIAGGRWPPTRRSPLPYRIRRCWTLGICSITCTRQRSALGGVAKGATQKNISQTVLRSWPLPLPPLREQERIVAAIEEHLSRVDAAELVVRPSRSKLNALRQTTISEVLSRKAWTMVRWSEVGETLSGRAFPSAFYGDVGIRLLRPGNLSKSGRVTWGSKATTSLPERFAAESPKYVLHGRHLLMNLTAQSLADDFLGRVCMSNADDRFLLNQRIAKVSSPSAHDDYLFWVFRSASFRRFVAGLNTGSLIQHISTKQLASFVLPLPPLEDQRSLIDEIDAAVQAIDRMEVAVDLLPGRSSRLRSSILAAAFSGQIAPQDPGDEPTSVLLDRIRAEPAVATPAKRTRKAKAS